MRKFYLVLIVLMLGSLVACSSTSSLTSAPVTYRESRAGQNDVPVIRGKVTVLFRKAPSRGAVNNFMSGLVKSLEGITPAGVVATLGTSPERAFSELERGRRAQFSVPFAVDNPDGEDITVSITTKDLEEAAREAADGLPVSVNEVAPRGFKLQIKTREVKGGGE